MLATVEGMKWLVLKKECLSIQGLHDWLLSQDEALHSSASRAKQTEVAPNLHRFPLASQVPTMMNKPVTFGNLAMAAFLVL